MVKTNCIHIYSQDGGILFGNVPDIEEARKLASNWANKNVGKAANIFTVMESHICEVAPLKIISAGEVHGNSNQL